MSLADDETLVEWISCILFKKPEAELRFLVFIANAATVANQEQYTIIRPALMELKAKYPRC